MEWQWKVKGGGATAWPVGRGNFNNRYNVNGYNYDNRASRGIVPLAGTFWGTSL